MSSIVGQDNHKMFTFRVDPMDDMKSNQKSSKMTDSLAKNVLKALNKKEPEIIDAEVQVQVQEEDT
jgi:TolB-like protein